MRIRFTRQIRGGDLGKLAATNATVRRIMERLILRHGIEAGADIRRAYFAKGPRGKEIGGRVVGTRVQVQRTGITGYQIQVQHIGGRLYEYGGTVTAKGNRRIITVGVKPDGTRVTKMSRGLYLTIPLKAAKTRSGRPRGAWIDSIAFRLSKGRAYRTWVAIGPSGSPIIKMAIQPATPGGKVRVLALAVLKRAVTHKARPIVEPAMRLARDRVRANTFQELRSLERRLNAQ
jgi:hypothetical protein